MTSAQPPSYFDTSGWDPRAVVSGGSRLIPIETPSGTFRVWTKRVGTNPDLKVLLLHGGPGATDELYECFDTWFPGAGVEYHYYDQLGSFRSDQPDDASLWTLERFVDEVEQVRQALDLTAATSCCSGSRGAACWRWSTRSTTSSTSRDWSSPT
jgi:proline iminopeptidase